MQIQVIPVSAIEIPATLLRDAKTDTEGYQGIMNSIKADGGLKASPILVRPRKGQDGSTVMELVDGRQRLQACKELGFTEIHAVVQEMSDQEAILKQMVLNQNRVATSKREYSNAFANLLAMDPTYTVQIIAEATGFSASFIRDHLALQGIKSDAINSMLDSGLTLGKAKIIAKAPAEVQDKLADIAMSTSQEQFEQEAAAAIKTHREAAKAAPKEEKPEVFEPKATLKDKATLQAILTDSAALTNLVASNSCTSLEDAIAAGIKFALDLDAAGIAAQKSKWDAKQAEKAQKAAERAEKAAKLKENFEAMKGLSDDTGALKELSEKEKAIKAEKAQAKKKMVEDARAMVQRGEATDLSTAIAMITAKAAPEAAK